MVTQKMGEGELYPNRLIKILPFDNVAWAIFAQDGTYWKERICAYCLVEEENLNKNNKEFSMYNHEKLFYWDFGYYCNEMNAIEYCSGFDNFMGIIYEDPDNLTLKEIEEKLGTGGTKFRKVINGK